MLNQCHCGEGEEFAALVVASGGKITLVIAVEMNLEGLAVGVVTVQQLRGDVRCPAAAIKVGTQSLEEKMPLISVCGFTTLGQRTDGRRAIAALPVAVLLQAAPLQRPPLRFPVLFCA
jgi:hypothetical protein